MKVTFNISIQQKGCDITLLEEGREFDLPAEDGKGYDHMPSRKTEDAFKQMREEIREGNIYDEHGKKFAVFKMTRHDVLCDSSFTNHDWIMHFKESAQNEEILRTIIDLMKQKFGQ